MKFVFHPTCQALIVLGLPTFTYLSLQKSLLFLSKNHEYIPIDVGRETNFPDFHDRKTGVLDLGFKLQYKLITDSHTHFYSWELRV